MMPGLCHGIWFSWVFLLQKSTTLSTELAAPLASLYLGILATELFVELFWRVELHQKFKLLMNCARLVVSYNFGIYIVPDLIKFCFKICQTLHLPGMEPSTSILSKLHIWHTTRLLHTLMVIPQ